MLPNAQVPGPIPEDFDFDPFLEDLPFLARIELPLITRIAANVGIERANNASLAQTIAVRYAPVPRPADLDVGPPMQPLYAYSRAEFMELVTSEQVCQSMQPLPVGLARAIAKERLAIKTAADSERLAEKATEKEASSIRNKLLGSMRLTNPIPRVMARAEAVTIPSIYLLGMKNGACPPLNFFTNEHIEAVTHSHSLVHTKMLRPFGIDDTLSAEKVQLLDLPKMIALWGSDDKHTCLTPMRFKEASKNFLAALKLVSETAVVADDGTSKPTFASEYEKHFNFFDQLKDFEETYPSWYSFELRARREILQGILFSWDVYALEVKMIQHAKPVLAAASSSKRPAEADNRNVKQPRQSFRSDVSSSREETTPSTRDSAATCLICGRGHRYRDHPTATVAFEDGKQLFSRLSDNSICTVRNFKGTTPKRLCVIWNLSRPCDNRHGTDAIHACTLCGGEHAALTRDPACGRVSDSRIRA